MSREMYDSVIYRKQLWEFLPEGERENPAFYTKAGFPAPSHSRAGWVKGGINQFYKFRKFGYMRSRTILPANLQFLSIRRQPIRVWRMP